MMDSVQLFPKKALLLLLMFLLFIVAFYPVWNALVSKWSTSDEYSHGFFILPICFYIIFNKREELTSTPINPSGFGLIIVVGSLFLHLFSSIAEIVTLASVSMVFTVFGIVLYLFGTPYFKALSFPFFLMFLMIPIPGQVYATLGIPLQLFVSKMSHSILYHFVLPIYREGNVIFTPQATLEVVQACSGLRSMISLFTLSIVFGYFVLRSKVFIVVLSFLSIPTAVFVNVLRVMITVIALHYFDYNLTVGSVHTIYGLLIFIIALAIIMLVSKVLSRWDISKPTD